MPRKKMGPNDIGLFGADVSANGPRMPRLLALPLDLHADPTRRD